MKSILDFHNTYLNNFVRDSGAEIISADLKFMENEEHLFYYALILYKNI